MTKKKFKSLLNENSAHPTTIQGIYNWCDRWCEKCKCTENCTVFKTSSHLTTESPEDFFKNLSMIFEVTMEMLKELSENVGIDLDTLKEADSDSDLIAKFEQEKEIIRKSDSVALAKKYTKKVKKWLDSLKNKRFAEMEIRLQDPILSDCLEIIHWYQYFLEIKMERAILAQKEEIEEESEPLDSLGTAKLILVSIERNISAWGYVYKKFQENEDEILDILICLQKLGKKIEQIFPNARAFVRPGLDEQPK